MLDDIPSEACGLGIETLVVDDGSTDGTSEVARAAGVHVARLERNCGHGVALRVGYQLAREHGARFIVTLDADGQWDPVELPKVLEPLANGEADMVIGSRVLGRTETDDQFRQAGVHVFAALVRVLTGARGDGHVERLSRDARRGDGHRPPGAGAVPDVRAAHRRDLPGLPDRRAADRHAPRAAGESKKGHNLLYGFRYARVILRTWWRERTAARNGRAAATLRTR